MVGNLPNFTKIDVLRCLLKIEKPISRLKLSKTLDLGEGTIRSKKGHSLSTNGNSIVKKIKSCIDMGKVNLQSMYQDKKKIAVHIKDIKKVEKAYELRDIAIKNGADGALILDYDNGLKFYEWTDSDYTSDFKEIEKKFHLSKDDLIIVAYADSYKLAEYGALAVAIELNNNLKNLIQKLK